MIRTLVLMTALILEIFPALTVGGHEAKRANEMPSELKLSIVSEKGTYRRSDQFTLHATLTNPGPDDVYIFGNLNWGYSASLMFHILDESGKEVEPILTPDSPPSAPPEDSSGVAKLRPNHFLGTTYFAPMKLMNLTRPGRYSIFVEYSSPFSSEELRQKSFWGKEKGIIKSNVVVIHVRR